MWIFDLPAEDKRIYSNNIFQILNTEDKQWVKEPDYYIIYRIGCDLRIAAIISGVVVFAICCLHRYAGYFPELAEYPDKDSWIGLYLHYISAMLGYVSLGMSYPERKDFLELYLYLINGTGPIFLFSLVYYGVWFRKNISFSKYNILRQSVNSYTNFTSVQLWAIPVAILLGGFFGLAPATTAAFFYMELHRGFFDQFFDSPFFVAMISILIMICHSIFIQFGFKHMLIQFYVLYEKSLK